MTAPAVLRRWGQPHPVAVDGGGVAPNDHVQRDPSLSDSLGTAVRELLVRIRLVAPLATVLLTGLVAHVAMASHLVVWGAAPDVLLVAVAGVAVGRGPRAGAGFGFAAGLGADLFLATPVGTSALAFTLLGHGLGRSSRPRSPGTAGALCSPASTCALGVVAGRLGAAVVATTLGGVPFPGSPGIVRIAVVAAISAPLGPPVFAAVRRLGDGLGRP